MTKASTALHSTESHVDRTPSLQKVITHGNADTRSRPLFPRADIQQGLHFDGFRLMDFPRELWLQAVDQNPLGQWLAFQKFGYDDVFTILQRHCCLECTCERIEKMMQGKPDDDIPKRIRIVNARLEGEDMD